MIENYYSTLGLNPKTWDFKLDSRGWIIVEYDKMAIAQDVASACLAFKSEIVFRPELGVDWTEIAGHKVSKGFITDQLQKQALTVEVIIDAIVYLNFDHASAILYGVIVCEDIYGNVITVAI